MAEPASNANPTPLVLVDGSSYLFRAYHAMPNLSNSAGEPTGAVYGVINMIRKLLKDYDPQRIAVVFDAKGPTFRNELYAEYKANRPPMPEDLAAQIPAVHAIVEAMGLPLLVIDGVEADDVIGTLARQATERGMDVVISTGDKDMAQLVDDHVTLVNTMTDTVSDRQAVIDKFGVPPERITDYLALIGDTVDNVPGVAKVGPKTAARWLQQYGSLENLIAHADEIRGKVGENLRASLEQLPLSKELVTIRTDVELPVTLDDLQRREPDREKLIELFRRYEFKSWLADLLDSRDGDGEAAAAMAEARYSAIHDMAELEAWLARLREAELFAFDLETTSLDYMAAEIVGCSFAVQPGEAAYVPLAHADADAPAQLARDAVLEKLRPLLSDPQQAKVGQHSKYDMNVLASYGIALRGVEYDTMLESYVLDPSGSRHDMDTLALKYLGYKTVHYEEIAGKGAKQKSFDQIPVAEAAPYAAEDADITLRLHRALWPRLAEIPALTKVFREIEMPLVPVLSRMERRGVLLDVARLEQQSRAFAARLKELEEQAWLLAGEEFNLGSPKQLQAILFGKLGLPVLAKTPKGQPSTAESVLQELAAGYELPRIILEHRSLAKLKSTYTDKLPRQVNPRTGRVHTSYHQAVTATGRLSSSDPNLQNIPVRSEEGRRIRQAFIAPEGYRLLAADYSQIELRIMAHLSGDEGLLAAFAAGEDIHRTTAAEVFGVPPEQVTADMRRSAKAINFGLIYGMSAFGLARQLDVDRPTAQQYIDRYFARYPGVKAFMERTREQAREQGYVETVFGRRLYIQDIRSANTARRQYAERTAINAPMQGTAADIIKRAMIGVDAWIERERQPVNMIMQVHDELVFEVAAEAVDSAHDRIREIMIAAADLRVPLEVDIGVGDNWDEAH